MTDTIDTTAKVIKFVGDLAQAALIEGPTVLTIVELLAPWIPALGPVVTDIAVALPILQKIAKYAPVVSQGIEQEKPLIQATISVGAVLISPLQSLLEMFPDLGTQHPFFIDFAAFLKSNEFTPQDPRFDNNGIGSQS